MNRTIIIIITLLLAAVVGPMAAHADAPHPTSAQLQERIEQEPFLCYAGSQVGLTCDQAALLKLRWDWQWGWDFERQHGRPPTVFDWQVSWRTRANNFMAWLGALNAFDWTTDEYRPQYRNAVRLQRLEP